MGLTNSSLEEQLKVSQWCRSASPVVNMIVADVRGLYAQIFTDFGPKFSVVDTTGEQPITAMIASITKEANAVVTTLDEARHGLEDGDVVTFSIGDTTGFSDYERGGVVLQVKQPKVVSFKPL